MAPKLLSNMDHSHKFKELNNGNSNPETPLQRTNSKYNKVKDQHKITRNINNLCKILSKSHWWFKISKTKQDE
jgi:hypothetical protein